MRSRVVLPQRASMVRMTGSVTAMHPAVGEKSGRDRWKNIALPPPCTLGFRLWLVTTTTS